MCGGGGGLFGGGASKPKIVAAPTPQVAATPPPVEETAQAPTISEGAKRQASQTANRKGTAALKIALNLGGMGGENGGGGLGSLNIPQ